MKLYDSIGPNPRLVRMFMHEKGIEIEREEIDLMGGENRRAPYTDKNPAGELPCLELDDGSMLAETVAICEYLEELQPDPPLVGSSPQARAATRMWIRRIENKITNPMTDGFRSAEGQALFKDRRHLIPQAADDLKTIGQEGLVWLEEQMAGRDYVAGDQPTLADILLFAMLDFGRSVGQPIHPDRKQLSEWFDRMAARESAQATA